MLVSVRNALKQIGVIVIVMCAAFVLTLFLTYRSELQAMELDIEPGLARTPYDAQTAASEVALYVTGECLIGTSVVVLCAYVSSYVQRMRKELGLLKAMGYSAYELASEFWVFGVGGAIGGAIGTCAGWLYLPVFFDTMSAPDLMPAFAVRVRPEVMWWTTALPAVIMTIAAILTAVRALERPVLSLLRSDDIAGNRPVKTQGLSFMAALKRSILSTRKSLLFFMFIGGFCYACMMQMAPSMKDLASESMGAMMFLIGIILAVTALVLAARSAVQARVQTLALMHAVGYSSHERLSGVLGIYRPFAWLGFAVGTVYQWALLRVMVDYFYKDFPGLPSYSFDGQEPPLRLCVRYASP